MHPVVRILTNYYAGESFYPIEFLETRHPENLRAGIKPVKYIYESKVNAVSAWRKIIISDKFRKNVRSLYSILRWSKSFARYSSTVILDEGATRGAWIISEIVGFNETR